MGWGRWLRSSTFAQQTTINYLQHRAGNSAASPKASAKSAAGGTSQARSSIEKSHLYDAETQKCFVWSSSTSAPIVRKRIFFTCPFPISVPKRKLSCWQPELRSQLSVTDSFRYEVCPPFSNLLWNRFYCVRFFFLINSFKYIYWCSFFIAFENTLKIK